MRRTEVFVPSDFPAHTYVERGADRLERRLREALETPRSPISISGPSKTGKTALVKKIVGEDSLIHIFGTQIANEESLWDAILQWMDTPSSVTKLNQASESISPTAKADAAFGIPGIAKVTLGGGLGTTTQSSQTTGSSRDNKGMSAVAREIADSEFIVFLDDFHYINRALQELIGRQIKTASELGIRFCIASVPSRSDDVVRSNHELRGRTINIDTSFWSRDDLMKIASLGFDALNFGVQRAVIKRFAEECCTSPQIMQALCLQLCFDKRIEETSPEKIGIKVNSGDLIEILEKTSSRADYSSVLRQMHSGPKSRGTERKEFKFRDGSVGDAYRAILLAIKENPPSMSYNYTDMLARIDRVCENEKPVGSSITESLKQISGIADRLHPTQRIVEWDAEADSGTFSIIDPYFLFFLRSSELLKTLSIKK